MEQNIPNKSNWNSRTKQIEFRIEWKQDLNCSSRLQSTDQNKKISTSTPNNQEKNNSKNTQQTKLKFIYRTNWIKGWIEKKKQNTATKNRKSRNKNKSKIEFWKL